MTGAAIGPWDPVDRLAGVGPRLRAALAEHGVRRVADLLLHLPARYEDRTQRSSLDGELEDGRPVLLAGRVALAASRWTRRRGLRIVSGVVSDGRGSLPVVWFNQPWIARTLSEDRTVSLYGVVRRSRSGRLELVNPEINEIDGEDAGERILPVYPRLGPLSGRRLRRLIAQALDALPGCPDPLPADLRVALGVPGLAAALAAVHDPQAPPDELERTLVVRELAERGGAAHRRLVVDELLAFACSLAGQRAERRRLAARPCAPRRPLEETARGMLPFELTGAQRRVAAEISDDLAAPQPMARLVQGDVGCGKTALAALAIRQVLESGHQAALMAPTELLAEQHAATLARLFEPLGCPVRLLTGSLSAVERSAVLGGLADGSERLVVGTHALIQERVRFADLGLVVVDEQHRFGVLQRQRLVDKGVEPHLLVMTATPIPRSLALTLYGDLDLSVVDELPPGRRPVTTVIRRPSDKARIWPFVAREAGQGGRVFVVYPAIVGNEELELPGLEDRAAEVADALPGVRLGVAHGRMPAAARDEVVERFRSGEVQVLLTTTVVEVGLDVPEASVVLIEGADRFGLSQLHQLRGRVGRGDRRSWCILLTDGDATSAAQRRLEVLCRSSDGFEIAEADLELRGPGELTGVRQWGPAGFRVADLLRHGGLVEESRRLARRLADDGRLDEIRAALSLYHPVADAPSAG